MADSAETKLRLELEKEILSLKGQIKDLEEEIKESIVGTSEEAKKELELYKLRMAESIKQVELEKAILAAKISSGQNTEEELRKIEEYNNILQEQRQIIKDNIKSQENRIKLLDNEEEQEKNIKNNILGIIKAEDQRKTGLNEIKKVVESTSAIDLSALRKFGTVIGITQFIKSFDELITTVNLATNTAGTFNSVLSQIPMTMGRFGIDSRKVGESLISLRESFSQMSDLSVQSQGELAGFAAKMQVAGVTSDTTAKFLNTATKSFGFGVQQVQKYQKELFAFSRANGISMKAINDGLASVMPRLINFGKEGPKIFKDLAFQAKQMGVEMNKLLDITEQFTTFEGAAEAAGELNAALGGNLIDSLQLLRTASESPQDALEMLKNALQTTGKSFEDLSGQQRRLFSDILKTDPDTLAGLFRKTSAEAKQAAINEKQFNDAIAQFVPIGEKMQAIFAKLSPAIEMAASILGKFVDLLLILLDLKPVAWLFGIVGGFFALTAAVLSGAGIIKLFLGQTGLMIAGLKALLFSSTAAATGLQTAGASAVAAGAQMAAGAQIASTGILASLSAFINGLGGLGAITAAITPILLPLAGVILAIGAAFLMAGVGIMFVFRSITEFITALGASFNLIGESMLNSKDALQYLVDLDLTKLISIRNILKDMSEHMQDMALSSLAFSSNMFGPLKILPLIAGVTQTAAVGMETKMAQDLGTNILASKGATNAGGEVTVNLKIDSPIMLGDKQMGRFVESKVVKISKNAEYSVGGSAIPESSELNSKFIAG